MFAHRRELIGPSKVPVLMGQSPPSALGAAQGRGSLHTMSLQRRLVEHILAAVLLCAALFAPSLASAHAGHSHHAAATTVEPVNVPAATEHVASEPKSSQSNRVRREVARASAPASDPGVSHCASHCCGGTANMTCCAAALVSEISVIPSFTASHALPFARAGALLGLPPEAPPKPPKPFA